jgi:hypothetical protein
VLSDLRDPGEIEGDADIVMLAPRPGTCEPEDHGLRDFAEVPVRKHRSGALGNIPLNFRSPHYSNARPGAKRAQRISLALPVEGDDYVLRGAVAEIRSVNALTSFIAAFFLSMIRDSTKVHEMYPKTQAMMSEIIKFSCHDLNPGNNW